jgi:ATP-dependent DNA helicase RecG
MPGATSSSPIALTDVLSTARGLSTARTDALARLGILTVADLIRHLPMRYERQEAEASIEQIVPGTISSARGEITATRIVPRGKLPRFEAVLVDDTGRLDLVWFNQTYLKGKLFPGVRLRVQGMAKRHGPGIQMVNPTLEILPDETTEKPEPGARDARVRPVYPASEQINSQQIEKVVEAVLEPALKQIPDHLPPEFRAKRSLPELAAAYRMAHQPKTLDESREATRRLAYDELLMLQLGVFLRRAQLRGSVRAPILQWNQIIDTRIRERLPFSFTGAQERVVKEIVADLMSPEPANRLIQGDVGSGKTVVALYAMLVAVANKQQAALMAPTELLAEQHFLSISDMLKGSSVKVELLTGTLTDREKSAIHTRLAAGDIDIIIGTHALLTEGVRFESLAVAVIDEQHRFGVHQRAALRSKGGPVEESRSRGVEESKPTAAPAPLLLHPSTPPSPLAAQAPASPAASLPLAPHIIVMTATPIPRTLALTLLGDLDISVIDELPPGRTPIATRVVDAARSGEVYEYIRKRLDAGEQAYIVVPAIDSGASTAGQGGDEELNDLRTVMARLEAHEFAGKRIAALHGRLKRDTREAIMSRFRAGSIDALVATTVIEVGVDVPNATIMVVEHADHFGLAQLHQLRGRVGRGVKKSICVLIASAPPLTPDAEARLAAMAATTDGFELAETDLSLRGPGEVFGMRQAGAPPFRVADLMRDRDLLAMARRDAMQWIQRSPTLHAPGEDLLRKRLMKLHGQWLGLGDVG